jgi:hypothetical protein
MWARGSVGHVFFGYISKLKLCSAVDTILPSLFTSCLSLSFGCTLLLNLCWSSATIGSVSITWVSCLVSHPSLHLTSTCRCLKHDDGAEGCGICLLMRYVLRICQQSHSSNGNSTATVVVTWQIFLYVYLLSLPHATHLFPTAASVQVPLLLLACLILYLYFRDATKLKLAKLRCFLCLVHHYPSSLAPIAPSIFAAKVDAINIYMQSTIQMGLNSPVHH